MRPRLLLSEESTIEKDLTLKRRENEHKTARIRDKLKMKSKSKLKFASWLIFRLHLLESSSLSYKKSVKTKKKKS